MEEENRMLMQAYVRTPWLIQTTEDDLEKAGGLQKEVLPELPAVTHLVENEINVDLTQDVDTIRLKVRRPNQRRLFVSVYPKLLFRELVSGR